MDILTEEQKEQALQEFKNRQLKNLQKGKAIVITIALVNILMAVFNFVIMNFDLIALIIQIVFSIALIRGVSWIRYLFAIDAALNVIFTPFILVSEYYVIPPIEVILLLIYMAYSIACSILLFTYKGVVEYMYAAKNG